jgi:eukaryotic-like serine/threonine-protein kinase
VNAPADRHLLVGLLALRNGLINEGKLLAAFEAWTLDKSTSLAEHLEARGDLTAAKRALVEALAELHLEAHGGDVRQSLAAVLLGKSTRESLAKLGDPDIEATLEYAASAQGATDAGDGDAGRTTSYAVGTASGDGQRFRILRPHAQGGLGAVYVALDTELHREVALKQIQDSHADELANRERFVAEAEITGGLEHPGIVPVYSLGVYGDGRPYYAMRFIRGDNLKEAADCFHADAELRRDPGRRTLELHKLLRRFLDVCNAIHYAHSRGVLHRDIKPGNVIVGKHGETLVVDWGLAKALGRREPGGDPVEPTLVRSSTGGSLETLPGSVLGTPVYMSPEQAAGDLAALGVRSDVYSLGATLYYVLTGKSPFSGSDVGALLRAVGKGEFPPPRERDGTIDRGLESVCLKAMALSRDDRYATPRELADDLERWLADEPVKSYREPPRVRLQRWARRHRMWVQAAAALLLFASVVSIAAAVVIDRARNDERQARHRADNLVSDLAQEQSRTKKALIRAERHLAAIYFDRGLGLCELGEVDSGLLWLTRGLETVPGGAEDLERLLRLNLEAWSAESYPLRALTRAGQSPIALQFAPAVGAVATTEVLGNVRVWDVRSGQPRGALIPQKGSTRALALAPAGDLIATGVMMVREKALGSEVRLYRVGTGEVVGQALGYSGVVSTLAFSPTGRWLAAGGSGGVQLWETASGKPVAAALGPTAKVEFVIFSPDGSRLAAGCQDGLVELWNPETGTPIGKPLRHTGPVPAVAFNLDGSLLAVASGLVVQLWDVAKGEVSGSPLPHPSEVESVAFSPDGQTLLTGSRDGRARLWDVLLRRTRGPILEHPRGILAVAFGAADRTALTADHDGTVRVWHLATRQVPQPRNLLREGRIGLAVITRDLGTIVLAAGNIAQAWDARTGQRRGERLQHSFHIYALDVHGDSDLVVTGSLDNQARIWRLRSGELLIPPIPHRGTVGTAVFSPDGQRMLTGAFTSGKAQLWEVSSGKPVGIPLDHSGTVFGAAFSRDGRYVLTGYVGGARLWDISTAQPVGPILEHPGRVNVVALSPDGKRGFAGCEDRTARLWNLETFSPIGTPLRHRDLIRSAAFDPTGTLVLTGCLDQSARFWDVTTGEPVGPALRHPGAVIAVRFAADAKEAWTVTSNGSVHRWPVPTPLRGEYAEVQSKINVRTGMKLAPDDSVTFMDPNTWQQSRFQLGGQSSADDGNR